MSDDIVTRLREYDFMRDGDIPDLIMAKQPMRLNAYGLQTQS